MINTFNMPDNKTCAGFFCGILAAIMTPITLFFASAGAICIPFVYGSYTVLNCFVAFIVGYGTAVEVCDGTFEIDPSHDDRVKSNTEMKRKMCENHKFLHKKL